MASVYVCCDCGVWTEKKPEKCGVCGSLCFTKEKLEDVEYDV